MRVLLGILLLCLNFNVFAQGEKLEFDHLKINQLQYIATHNSYLSYINTNFFKFLTSVSSKANKLQYAHRPIEEQLAMGIRSFELDIYQDQPNGGYYWYPVAFKNKSGVPLFYLIPPPYFPNFWLAGDETMPTSELHELIQPGLKVFHMQDIEFVNADKIALFSSYLKRFKNWSDVHKDHLPIIILLEIKYGEGNFMQRPMIQPSKDTFLEIQKTILSIIPRNRIIAPEDIIGTSVDLRSAVEAGHWIKVKDARSKFMFVLDNTDAKNSGEPRDLYLSLFPDLKGGLIFPSIDPDLEQDAEFRKNAGFIKINEPDAEVLEHMQDLVKRGYFIRTRADADLFEAAHNQTARRERAFISGAQIVSSDFPYKDYPYIPFYNNLHGANPFANNYRVVFSDDNFIRINPKASEG